MSGCALNVRSSLRKHARGIHRCRSGRGGLLYHVSSAHLLTVCSLLQMTDSPQSATKCSDWKGTYLRAQKVNGRGGGGWMVLPLVGGDVD